MRTITVRDRQNLIDLAVQYYGSAAAVIDLCLDNDLELDNELAAGDKILVRDEYPDTAQDDVADYIRSQGIIVATDVRDDLNVLGDNSGNYIITNDSDFIEV